MLLYPRDPAKFGGVRGLTASSTKALIGGIAMVIPCGRCMDCRLAYSREWALRCMHEAQIAGESSFVTLTYDDAHLPVDWNLNYRHFQLFMHRLRKSAPGRGRFFMCAEYGDDYGRPHYHAILFGCVFPDRVYWKSVDGIRYYLSDELSKLWGQGFVSIGDATMQSAGYVARYNLKKITGPEAGSVYQFVTPDGEVVMRDAPFCQGSLRPGIGARWFERYRGDVFPSDFIVYDRRQFPVPRYYEKLYEAADPVGMQRVRAERRKHRDPDIYGADGPRDGRRLMVKSEHRALVSKQKRNKV